MSLSAIEMVSKNVKIQKTITHNIVSQKLPGDFYSTADSTSNDEIVGAMTGGINAVKEDHISMISERIKPVATQEMVEKIKKLMPHGFYGFYDSGLAALNFFGKLGYDVSEILVYGGGMTGTGSFKDLGNYFKAIMESWQDLVDFIKVSLQNDPDVTQIAATRRPALQSQISQFLFGTQSYLQTAYTNSINYRGKVVKGELRPAKAFIEKGSKFMDDKKAFEIYNALKTKKGAFGESWLKIHEKFSIFWAIRFGTDMSTYSQKFNTIKENVYDGLSSIFAKHLGLSKIKVDNAFIARILEPYRPKSNDPGFSDAGVTSITTSTIFRLISEVREFSSRRVIDSGRKRGAEPLKSLKETDIKDIAGLRRELEVYLMDFVMSDLTGYSRDALMRHKAEFDLEVFYALYKNTPLNSRNTLTLAEIQKEIKKFATVNGGSKVSQFGSYAVSPSYQWRSILTINAFLRQKVRAKKMSRADFEKVVRKGRDFNKEMGVSPANPTGYFYIGKLFKITINQANIDASQLSADKAGRRVVRYLQQLDQLGKGVVPAEYKNAVRKASQVFGMSKLSKDPYSNNLGFTSASRSEYITKFTNSIEYGTQSGERSIQQLIEYAKFRKTDPFVLNDVKLLELINPSTSLNNQPKHDFIQYLALRDMPSFIATEPFLWSEKDGNMFAGHPDFIEVIKTESGYKIRIFDYKPDLGFSPNSKASRHFIDSIPQVAGYGVLLDRMFGITAAGFELECITFNENGYYLYDPYEALESSVNFYYGELQKLPDWYRLLSQNIINKIISSHPPPS